MTTNKIVPRSIVELMADSKGFTKSFASPWLKDGTINMIFAPTGAGKSHWAFHLALAVAGGKIWMSEQCEKAKVLYIDGEMGGDQWLKRIPTGAFLGDINENFKLVCPEDFKDGYVKNLAVVQNHGFWKEIAQGFDVIIIDNYITTCQPTGRESDIEIFLKVKDLLIFWKNQGKAVVLVHHTNKGGNEQHGTVYKDVIMDTIFRLKQFPIQTLNGGITWEMKIIKDRNYFFKTSSEYLMDIIFGEEEVSTYSRDIDAERYPLISDMLYRGFTHLEIGMKFDISKLKINEIIQRFKPMRLERSEEDLI